jgi:hypothetical protein
MTHFLRTPNKLTEVDSVVRNKVERKLAAIPKKKKEKKQQQYMLIISYIITLDVQSNIE